MQNVAIINKAFINYVNITRLISLRVSTNENKFSKSVQLPSNAHQIKTKLSALKEILQKYCKTIQSVIDINHMWVLVNS